MKKLVSMFLAAATSIMLVACGGVKPQSTLISRSESTVVVETTSAPETTTEMAESIETSAAATNASAALEITNMPFSYPDKTRIIITTDGECDDFNSLHHILLYANDFDFAGIIYSASTYHFQGDGVHTLGEVTKNCICAGENAAQLTEYRPQEMGWIEKTIQDEYSVDHQHLVENDPSYPTPEQLLTVVKVGNVAFEGDVREATEGSDWIASRILDDDQRPLYIASWGGFNTVARALLTIHEIYGETADWDAIYEKVIHKVVIQGAGQDTTYKNFIAELYPDLKMINGVANGYGYQIAKQPTANVLKYFQSAWLKENIKFNHGKLMEEYHLIGDGAYYYGEPDLFQFGQRTTFGFNEDTQVQREQYDWLGEGDSMSWLIHIPVGLRGMENGNLGTWCGRISVNGKALSSSGSYEEYNFYTGKMDRAFSSTRWLQALSEDWAARCDWTVSSYDECNHPPVVNAKTLDISGAAGETVSLTALAEDPDGDLLKTSWWLYREVSEYNGIETELSVAEIDALTASFIIPKDAVTGDYFNIIFEVKDDASAPMTRYAQIIVTVK